MVKFSLLGNAKSDTLSLTNMRWTLLNAEAQR